MNNPVTKGRGKTAKFLWDNAAYEGDDCLIWPFHRLPNGYGRFGYLGLCRYAHRFMCVLAHGEAPTAEHQATHTCGKGHDGCVNPRHLEWKTNGENQLDRREHGTKNNATWGLRGKLTREQRAQIRDLKGQMTQRKIAEKFGVTFQNVSHIQRNDPKDRPLTVVPFEKREDAYLIANYKGDDSALDELGLALGRKRGSIRARLYRLGLKSSNKVECR